MGNRGAPKATAARPAAKARAKFVDDRDALGKVHQPAVTRSRSWQDRRDLDAKVDRAMEMHFSFLPVHIREHKRINEKRLRDQIYEDMVEIEGAPKRLSVVYWQELAEKWSTGCYPAAELAVENADEAVGPALVLALECLHETRNSDSVISGSEIARASTRGSASAS